MEKIQELENGMGARLSGHPIGYTGWMFFLTAFPLLIISFARKGREAAANFRLNWGKGLVGGACTLSSYALALWAMTQAPIALVAALRETSIIFGTLIAAGFLKERVSPVRFASIFIITAGAIAIKIS